MTTIDLNHYSAQINRLERANRLIEEESVRLAPKHPHKHPVHVMYGGAHLFNENTFAKIAQIARDALQFASPNAEALRQLVHDDWTEEFARDLHAKLEVKIQNSPLEDYRIDFEDGYGVRPDDEEDYHAANAGALLCRLAAQGKTPMSVGFRIKPLSAVAMRRSLRTLTLFVRSFFEAGGKDSGLKRMLVTLPKVINAEQPATLTEILEGFERQYDLAPGFFQVELLVESPEAFLALDGTIPLPSFVAATRGRCQSLHFGVYDFTSSLGIGSAGQAVDHLACDFARLWMQVLSGLAPGIGISDGIINRLPIVPKNNNKETMDSFVDNWRYNYQQITRSLRLGYYQGWDLHPAQLPIRHAANYAFVLRELTPATARLKTFIEKSAQASHVGGLFDDRASVLGLINFFERGLASGVISESEMDKKGVNLAGLKALI